MDSLKESFIAAKNSLFAAMCFVLFLFLFFTYDMFMVVQVYSKMPFLIEPPGIALFQY